MNKKSKVFLAGSVFIAGAFLLAAGFVFAQTAQQNSPGGQNLQGITFPVAELGNCKSQSDCRSYCNDTSNMDSCTAFAQSHGLISKDDALKQKKFAEILQSSGGPGGCSSPEQCSQYCSQINNLDTCLAFAKSHNIGDSKIAQGEKMQAYIKSGGKTPGNCGSEGECKAYCNNFSNAQECSQFAKAVGMDNGSNQPGDLQGGGGLNQGHQLTPDQLAKISQLAKDGQTPGGCQSKDDCAQYCADGSHKDECLSFAVNAGFMTQDQADQIKNSGQMGPGGCNSEQSCSDYCNNPSHSAECISFAKNNGFINKNQQQQIENGLIQVRSGLEQAPPEVLACIKASVDQSSLDSIMSGQLVPGLDISGKIQACFEQNGHKNNTRQIFSNLPDDVLSCVKDKLGDDFEKIKSGQQAPSPEMADTLRVCFQSSKIGQIQEQGGKGDMMERGQNMSMDMGGGDDIKNFIKTAPQNVSDCLKNNFGDDEYNKVESGSEQASGDALQKIQTCFNNFRPAAPASQPPPDNPMNGSGPQPVGAPENPIDDCAKAGGTWFPDKNYCQFPDNQNNQQAPLNNQNQQQPNLNPGQIPPQTGPNPSNCPQGQYWNGKECSVQPSPEPTSNVPVDPQSACAKDGGVWDGSICTMPNTNQPTSFFPPVKNLLADLTSQFLQLLGLK